MFLAPKIFLKTVSCKILDQDYEMKHTSHHSAKFCDDQPTELADLVAKKNK